MDWTTEEIYYMNKDGLTVIEISEKLDLDVNVVKDVIEKLNKNTFETRRIEVRFASGEIESFRAIKDSVTYQKNYISFDAVYLGSTNTRELFHVDLYMNNLGYVAYKEDMDPVEDAMWYLGTSVPLYF